MPVITTLKLKTCKDSWQLFWFVWLKMTENTLFQALAWLTDTVKKPKKTKAITTEITDNEINF